MIMKKRIVLLISGGLLAAGLVTGCSHSTPEEKAARIVDEIQEELNLQDDQLVKLNALKYHMLELRKTHKATKEKTHKELRALLDQPVLDQAAVLAKINEKTAMVNKKAPKVVALLGDFYDSLNDSQRAEVSEKVDKFSKRHKRWQHD